MTKKFCAFLHAGENMISTKKLSVLCFCLLGLSACHSEPDIQIDDDVLTTTLPERIREVARLGTVPLRLRVTVNDTTVRERGISNDITENIQVVANVPADQTNNIKIEWLALPDGVPVVLADFETTTGPNQENLLVDGYIDEGDRFDFDGDGIFNLQEARENRNIAGTYELEVPFQTSFLGATEELVQGSADSDTSGSVFTPDEPTKFSLRHDGTNMYLYVCGQDEVVTEDGVTGNPNAYWHDDAVFLYLDGADSDNTNYDGVDDFQIAFLRSSDRKIVSKGGNNPFCPNGDCVTFDFQDPSSSTQCVYELSVTLPLAELNITLGTDVGFDLEITDDDDGDLREGSSGYVGFDDNSDLDPSTFGKIILR